MKKWKPKVGDVYYCPSFSLYGFYSYSLWRNLGSDMQTHENNILFKTKEEAIACAKFMLKAWKDREK